MLPTILYVGFWPEAVYCAAQPFGCSRPEADIAISRSYASQLRPVSIRDSLEYAVPKPKAANRETYMVKEGEHARR